MSRLRSNELQLRVTGDVIVQEGPATTSAAGVERDDRPRDPDNVFHLNQNITP